MIVIINPLLIKCYSGYKLSSHKCVVVNIKLIIFINRKQAIHKFLIVKLILHQEG